MPRWNYASRNRRDVKPKRSALEKRTERICQMLDAIEQAKEISDSELQIVLFALPNFGPGTYERTARDIKHDYADEVNWNKKERMWRRVPQIPLVKQIVGVTN